MATAIQWTDETWNPTTGCSRVSEGCRNCYIERTPPFRMQGRKLGDAVQFHPDRLDAPLHWKKPRRVFVNSLSDLFHDDVPEDFIKLILRVIAACPQHTFQVLTKRPQRMRRLMEGTKHCDYLGDSWGRRVRRDYQLAPDVLNTPISTLRLDNLHLGVSVEDQQTADERIPHILKTPAAVRFVSLEPLLGPIQLGCSGEFFDYGVGRDDHNEPRIHWVIVGGESGPKARPCDVAWIRSIVQQCQAARVACFVKQLGREPRGICSWKKHNENPPVWLDEDGTLLSVSGAKVGDLCHAQDDFWWPCKPKLNDKKGGDPKEWPADLRVREWPG